MPRSPLDIAVLVLLAACATSPAQQSAPSLNSPPARQPIPEPEPIDVPNAAEILSKHRNDYVHCRFIDVEWAHVECIAREMARESNDVWEQQRELWREMGLQAWSRAWLNPATGLQSEFSRSQELLWQSFALTDHACTLRVRTLPPVERPAADRDCHRVVVERLDAIQEIDRQTTAHRDCVLQNLLNPEACEALRPR